MDDISRQFQSNIIPVKWIEESFDVIKSLKNKIPFIGDYRNFKSVSDFWTMGPKKDEPGKYFIWYTDPFSVKKEILSITVIPRSPHIMVFCSDFIWRRFNTNKSAHAWAQTMDLFLNRVYTDIPPMRVIDIVRMLKNEE